MSWVLLKLTSVETLDPPSKGMCYSRAQHVLPVWQLSEAERELKRTRFEEALSLPEDHRVVSDTIALDDMVIEDTYKGPRMEGESASGTTVLPATRAV